MFCGEIKENERGEWPAWNECGIYLGDCWDKFVGNSETVIDMKRW